MRTYAFIVLLLATVCLGADTTPESPKSQAAINAKMSHDYAVKKAHETCQQAIAIADAKFVVELKDALKIAANNGATDEVTRIAGEIKGIGNVSTAKGDINWIVGTSWLWNNKPTNVFAFGQDGTVYLSTDRRLGKFFVIDTNTVMFNDPNGKVQIIFCNDRKHCIWVYANGDYAFGVRK